MKTLKKKNEREKLNINKLRKEKMSADWKAEMSTKNQQWKINHVEGGKSKQNSKKRKV